MPQQSPQAPVGGLLAVPPNHRNVEAPPNPSMMHNLSMAELLAELFKRGLLAPAARTLTPVDPVGNRPIEEALHVRDRQMRERGLR